MKRLSWNGVIFALAVCLIPAAASATDYTYRFYIPLDLTAVGPPFAEDNIACGLSNDAQGMAINYLNSDANMKMHLDRTGSDHETIWVEAHTHKLYRFYRCAFQPRYGQPPSKNFPQSMLRGVWGTLPNGKYYRPSNRNHMQMNRGNFSIPPPMKLR